MSHNPNRRSPSLIEFIGLAGLLSLLLQAGLCLSCIYLASMVFADYWLERVRRPQPIAGFGFMGFAGLFAFEFAISFRRHYRKWLHVRRATLGQCVDCGYDLRSSV